MDGHQPLANHIAVVGQTPLFGHRRAVNAFGQVVDVALALVHGRAHRVEVRRVVLHQGIHAVSVLARRELFGVEVARQHPRGRREAAAALDGGGAAHQGLGLDVGQERRPGSPAQQALRSRDLVVVGLRPGPLVVVDEGLHPRGEGPQADGVVGNVVVTVDQARVGEAVVVDAPRPGKGWRQGLARLEHRNNAPVVADEDAPTGQEAVAVVEGDQVGLDDDHSSGSSTADRERFTSRSSTFGDPPLSRLALLHAGSKGTVDAASQLTATAYHKRTQPIIHMIRARQRSGRNRRDGGCATDRRWPISPSASSRCLRLVRGRFDTSRFHEAAQVIAPMRALHLREPSARVRWCHQPGSPRSASWRPYPAFRPFRRPTTGHPATNGPNHHTQRCL